MMKSYLHNNKYKNEDKDIKKINQIRNITSKSIVDVNILLNRVKIAKKNEIKRKIIFFVFTILAIFLFGTIMTLVK